MPKVHQNIVMEGIETNFRSIHLPTTVKLLVASKSQPAERILHLYSTFNQRLFGENYVQELVLKARELPPDITWHFIGRIQSNKIRTLLGIPNLELIETVDSGEHVEVIERECERVGRRIKVFVQVNSSGEDSKGGIGYGELDSLVDLIESKRSLEFEGLMTIGSSQEGEFMAMKEMKKGLEERLQRKIQLSMGMSGDWETAIRHGSTQVRIGTAIFGSRLLKESSNVP